MQLAVLVLEDEPEVRDAIVRDLDPLAGAIRVEAAEDVPDAHEVLADHRLPGVTGVDFLVELCRDEDHGRSRKVLVTGQADQQDTIRAVNEAGLDHYVTKPWDADVLRGLVRDELTTYVLEQEVDPLPFLAVLDARRVMPALRGRGDP